MGVEVLVHDGPEGLGEVLLPGLPIVRAVLLEALVAEQGVVVLLALLLAADELDRLAMQQAGLDVHVVVNLPLEVVLGDLLQPGLAAENWHG